VKEKDQTSGLYLRAQTLQVAFIPIRTFVNGMATEASSFVVIPKVA
jgi:hypothetical protein